MIVWNCKILCTKIANWNHNYRGKAYFYFFFDFLLVVLVKVLNLHYLHTLILHFVQLGKICKTKLHMNISGLLQYICI